MPLHIIPAVCFTALKLELTPDGSLRYLPQPLRDFCRANGIDSDAVIADEDLATAVIAEWYVLHLQIGGGDSAAETIIALLNARAGRT